MTSAIAFPESSEWSSSDCASCGAIEAEWRVYDGYPSEDDPARFYLCDYCVHAIERRARMRATAKRLAERRKEPL